MFYDNSSLNVIFYDVQDKTKDIIKDEVLLKFTKEEIIKYYDGSLSIEKTVELTERILKNLEKISTKLADFPQFVRFASEHRLLTEEIVGGMLDVCKDTECRAILLRYANTIVAKNEVFKTLEL